MKIVVDVTPEQAGEIVRRAVQAKNLQYMAGAPDIELVLLSNAIWEQFPNRKTAVCSVCQKVVDVTPKGNARQHGEPGCRGVGKPAKRGIVFEETKDETKFC